MPRPRKPARLRFRADKGPVGENGKPIGYWLIVDGGREIGTGAFGRGAQESAERALASYLSNRERTVSTGPKRPDEALIVDILASYVEGRGSKVAAPERLKGSVQALDSFWGTKTADTIKRTTCEAYVRHRAKPIKRTVINKKGTKVTYTHSATPSTCRRDLAVLQTALNFAVREGELIYAPAVTLPPESEPREDHITKAQARRLVMAARESKNKGLVNFILIGLHTGTRATTILRTRMTPSLNTPWIDLDTGIYHRRGALERETKKRRRDCRLPKRLITTLRNVKGEYAVEFDGSPVKSVRRSLDAACARAGIPRITAHILKHTAVTWYFENKGTREGAADFFSTNATTLERTYRKSSPLFQEQAVQPMDLRLSRPQQTPSSERNSVQTGKRDRNSKNDSESTN